MESRNRRGFLQSLVKRAYDEAIFELRSCQGRVHSVHGNAHGEEFSMRRLKSGMEAIGAVLAISCLGCAAVCASIAGAIGFVMAVTVHAIASAAAHFGEHRAA